jgi:hypothetical protein
MADKSSILKAFNNHFFDFVDNVISVIDDNAELQYGKSSLLTIKKANPTLIVKMWYSRIYVPYKDFIEKGDIEFMLAKDYTTDTSDLPNAKKINDLIDKLRTPIRDMSETNKQHCVKFVQNLSQLSALYSAQ